MFMGDLGFRVFKLDSSNIRAWEPNREDLPKTLEESVEHLKTDRTETDILFELLLKLGLDLTVPIEEKTIAGKTVHSIGAGTLIVCLAQKIAARKSSRWRWASSHGTSNWPRPARPPSSSATAPSPTTWPRPTSPPFSSSTGWRTCAACKVVRPRSDLPATEKSTLKGK